MKMNGLALAGAKKLLVAATRTRMSAVAAFHTTPLIAGEDATLHEELVHPSGIEGLIFGSWAALARREVFQRRSSGKAWPWWR